VVTTVKKRRGLPRDEVALAERLRGAGQSWSEIAAVFRERYGVNGRIAMRKAHCWSQRDAADAWNERWPAEPKTFKSFSYWENWPSRSGREPSLAILAQLAELYQCSVTDLLADAPDFRDRDPAHGTRALRERMPVPHVFSAGIDPVLDRLIDADVEEIAGVGLVWAQRLRERGSGYAVLQRLSAGLALAAAAHTALAPDLADEPPATTSPPRSLAGIWRVRSARWPAGEYFVVLREHRGRLLGQSLPQLTGARLRLDLQPEGMYVAGGWAEHPGYGWGTASYGALQLTLDATRRAMRGRWLGFGPDLLPQGGDWELELTDNSVNGQELLAHRIAA
jgi:transcriptional regulator with XRE-family HTH domain